MNALRYQRIYVAGDGTEAITLAAPGPDGPVLAVMRRLQLPRGALPFDTIRSQLIGKYGPPTAQGPEDDVMSDMFWVSGTPGPRMAICRAHLSRRIPIREWRRLDGIGSGEVDLSVRPAAWDWAVSEPPVDYAEQMSACGDVLSYAAEDATGLGGAAFSMLLIDADGLRQMDEALAGVPEAGAIEIDF